MNRHKINEEKELEKKTDEAKTAFPSWLQLGNICAVLIITCETDWERKLCTHLAEIQVFPVEKKELLFAPHGGGRHDAEGGAEKPGSILLGPPCGACKFIMDFRLSLPEGKV